MNINAYKHATFGDWTIGATMTNAENTVTTIGTTMGTYKQTLLVTSSPLVYKL